MGAKVLSLTVYANVSRKMSSNNSVQKMSIVVNLRIGLGVKMGYYLSMAQVYLHMPGPFQIQLTGDHGPIAAPYPVPHEELMVTILDFARRAPID